MKNIVFVALLNKKQLKEGRVHFYLWFDGIQSHLEEEE